MSDIIQFPNSSKKLYKDIKRAETRTKTMT